MENRPCRIVPGIPPGRETRRNQIFRSGNLEAGKFAAERSTRRSAQRPGPLATASNGTPDRSTRTRRRVLVPAVRQMTERRRGMQRGAWSPLPRGFCRTKTHLAIPATKGTVHGPAQESRIWLQGLRDGGKREMVPDAFPLFRLPSCRCRYELSARPWPAPR